MYLTIKIEKVTLRLLDICERMHEERLTKQTQESSMNGYAGSSEYIQIEGLDQKNTKYVFLL